MRSTGVAFGGTRCPTYRVALCGTRSHRWKLWALGPTTAGRKNTVVLRNVNQKICSLKNAGGYLYRLVPKYRFVTAIAGEKRRCGAKVAKRENVSYPQ
jgi:hypothetical protein